MGRAVVKIRAKGYPRINLTKEEIELILQRDDPFEFPSKINTQEQSKPSYITIARELITKQSNNYQLCITAIGCEISIHKWNIDLPLHITAKSVAINSQDSIVKLQATFEQMACAISLVYWRVKHASSFARNYF